MQPYLELSNIGIEFDTGNEKFRALDGVNLKVDKGEFICLIGHSGCGKSTLLNIIAGLNDATEGGVILEGREVRSPSPDRAVVFQNHALLPWMSVYDNVALAVKQVFRGRKSRREMAEWTRHNLSLVHMLDAADRFPHEISGGMKQRVGIARCLAMQPRVLLMDEPFGALDALTRAHLQDSLMEIHRDLGTTVVMITHDVDEAVLLSDRIVMMNNGPAANIGEVLDVPLPRPRDRVELATDEAFLQARQSVLRFLYSKQGHPESRDDGKAEAAAAPAVTASDKRSRSRFSLIRRIRQAA